MKAIVSLLLFGVLTVKAGSAETLGTITITDATGVGSRTITAVLERGTVKAEAQITEDNNPVAPPDAPQGSLYPIFLLVTEKPDVALRDEIRSEAALIEALRTAGYELRLVPTPAGAKASPRAPERRRYEIHKVDPKPPRPAAPPRRTH